MYGDPENYFGCHPIAEKITGCRSIVRDILARVDGPTPLILDVGSGRGEIMVAAALEGVGPQNIVGLELSQAMIDTARDRFGVTVLRQTIEEHVLAVERSYDAIVLNAVLEHVHDPNSMIAAAGALTRPGAILYIDTPVEPNLLTHVGNRMNRLRGSDAVYNLSPTFSPFHVFGFGIKTIQILLRNHGFAIEETRVWAQPYVPSNGTVSDRFRAGVATQVNRLANATGTASNMCVWARRT